MTVLQIDPYRGLELPDAQESCLQYCWPREQEITALKHFIHTQIMWSS